VVALWERWLPFKGSDHVVVVVMSGVGHSAIVSILDRVSNSLVLTSFVWTTKVSSAVTAESPLDATLPRLPRRINTILQAVLLVSGMNAHDVAHFDASLTRSTVSSAAPEAHL
jgi:hypothetical protein